MKRLVVPWAATALVLALVGALSLGAWDRLPDELPIHYGTDFQPDDYASRGVVMVLFPGIILGISALFSVLSAVDPRREHIRASERAITRIWVGLVVCFGLMHAGTVFAGTGTIEDGWAVPFSIGLMLAVIGNYFGKLRSNWFIGIRTPWTLSSELSWERTHRLGGRLFVLLGIAIMAAAAVGPAAFGPVVFGGLMAVAVVTAVYSFLVWQKDPARSRRNET